MVDSTSRDIEFHYIVFLGRAPETPDVLKERVGFDAAALTRSFITSGEFRDRVFSTMIAKGSWPAGLFADALTNETISWISDWFGLSANDVAKLRQSPHWAFAHGLLFGRESFLRDFGDDSLQEGVGAYLEGLAEAGPTIESSSGAVDLTVYQNRGQAYDERTHRIRLPRPEILSAIKIHFDYDWYSTQIGIDFKTEDNAISHYLAVGQSNGKSPSPYFDESHYLSANPTFNRSENTPFEHFVLYGEQQRRSPHPLIDLEWYIDRYEIKADRALEFYRRQGWQHRQRTHPAFWADWYAERNGIETDPLLHYLTLGHALDPNPIFSAKRYRARADVPLFETSLCHYLRTGGTGAASFCIVFDESHVRRLCAQYRHAGFQDALSLYLTSPIEIDPHPLFSRAYYRRQIGGTSSDNELALFLDDKALRHDPSPLFSIRHYLHNRQDVIGLNPLAHYLSTGWHERSQTHPLFDAEEYKRLYPDASAAGRNAVEHYSNIGFFEGRDIYPTREPITTASRLRKPRNREFAPVGRPKDGGASPSADARKGVFLHAFYPDLVEDILQQINLIPPPCTVFISTDTPAKAFLIRGICAAVSVHPFELRLAPNRGRDIAPMLVGFRDRLGEVDLVLHLHTKRSQHYASGFDDWREYLVRSNIGSKANVEAILSLFDDPGVGAVAPVDFDPIDPLVQWGGNLPRIDALVRMMTRDALSVSTSNRLELPTGSMFWFRPAALKPLLDLDLSILHFDPEKGQVDGTLAHAIERSFLFVAEIAGFGWRRFRQGAEGIEVAPCQRLLPTRSLLDPVTARIPEARLFTADRSDIRRPRLNLLIPTAERGRAYAGVSEALRIFFLTWQAVRDRFDCRLISTDTSYSNQLLPEFGGKVRPLDEDDDDLSVMYVDGTVRSHRALSIRKNDVFMAAAWWNATQARNLAKQQAELFDVPRKKFLYLIQDYECGFYAWSTKSALAEATYLDQESCVPIFNTQFLADFFIKSGYFENGIVYQPLMNEKIVAKLDLTRPREKKALIYMRPAAERNALEFADSLVFYAVDQDPEFWRDWRFLAIGEDFQAGALTRSGRIEAAGRLTLDQYADHLSTAAIGVSLMISPHPSYPPLEMAGAGVRVLTNDYMNKDLAKVHSHIRTFRRFDVEEVSPILKEMAREALSNPSDTGRPLGDWFFDGKSNLDTAIREIAAAAVGIAH